MRIRITDQKGFTLIEVIVTLVLVGITAALAGMWIVSVANGYVFTKMNASTVQKAQLAMTRLTKELAAIQSVTVGTGTGITYKRTDSILGTTADYTVGTQSGELRINNDALTDSVSGFTLRYCSNSQLNQTICPKETWVVANETEPSKIIEFTLTLTGASGVQSTFTRRVTPRNL